MRRAIAVVLLLAAAAPAAAQTVDYAAEAAKLLRGIAATLTVSPAELRRLEAPGAKPPTSCPAGDHGCAGRVAGLRPPAQSPVTLVEPAPFCLASDEGHTCDQASISLFAAGMVADAAASSSGNLAGASFIHLRGPGATVTATVLLPNWQDYGTIRMLRTDQGVADLRINGRTPDLTGMWTGQICWADRYWCGLLLFEEAMQPDAGADVTDLFGRVTNVITYRRTRPDGPQAGLLLQLVGAGDLLSAPRHCPWPLATGCAYRRAAGCATRIGGVCVAAPWKAVCSEASACRRLACPGRKCDQAPAAGGGAAEVARTLAALEIGRQATRNYEQWQASVFKGSYAECRDKIAWGLGDCCKASAAGKNTSNKEALAQLGLRQAIREVAAVGSPHTHDVLFLTSDLSKGIKALGRGGLSSLQPSLSYYGLKVKLAGGVLKFSFDPASFAVAVALAVVANLLKCSSEEQLLGLRVGAGLCRHQRSWCSKRRFFGCKEEREAYCCHRSRLAKAAAAQLNSQLAKPGGFCGGYTVAELEQLDMDKMDLREFLADFGVAVDEQQLQRYRTGSVEHARDKAEEASKRP